MVLGMTKREQDEVVRNIILVAAFIIAIVLALIIYDSIQTLPELDWLSQLLFPADFIHFVAVVLVFTSAIILAWRAAKKGK